MFICDEAPIIDRRLSLIEAHINEKRLLRGNMIEMYKIMQVMDKVDRGKLFSLTRNTRTRGAFTQIECWESENRQKKFLCRTCC